MKKLLLITSLLTIALTGTGQIKIGPEGGLNISNYHFPSIQRPYGSYPVIGFRLGIIADLAIAGDNCYLQPGVLYAHNGTTLQQNSYTLTASGHYMSVKTIEVSMNVLYKFGNPGNSRFFIGGGIYGGKNIHSDAIYINSSSFDIGGGINAGFELKQGLLFRATAQKGFLTPRSYNITVQSSNIVLTAGYLFNRNRAGGVSGKLPDNLMQ